MSLTQILHEKDANPTEQLEKVNDVVSVARKAYGNAKSNIESPMCETTEGRMSFVHLADAGKVGILCKQLGLIKAAAVEYVEQTPGASMDKKIEELLATNAYFVNAGSGTKFAYL